MNKKIANAIVFGVTSAAVIAGLIVGNSMVKRYESEINSVLNPPIIDQEALNQSASNGQELSKKLMQEGAILLQNDGTLPLDYSVTKKVNVFGWRSVDWIHGSDGRNASGRVAPEDGDYTKNIDLVKALQNYGVETNTRLYNMYRSYSKPMWELMDTRNSHINDMTPLREPNITDLSGSEKEGSYTNDLLDYCKNFSDTAFVVIGRMAGEGMNCSVNDQVKEGNGAKNDNSRHYLEISTEEEALLRYCGENYANVVVFINAANPFEMGFMKTIPGLDAAMYVGFTGTRAASALPKLIYGEVSPSGRTVDTFPYDLFTNPANIYLGGQSYLDFNKGYTDAIENVYLGYKWYESADQEHYWDKVNNEYGKGYDGVVYAPFGYGLSYNEYSWNVSKIQLKREGEETVEYEEGVAFTDKDKIEFTVSVTNNGKVPGQDVVEIYAVAPYYGHSEDEAIEKPYVNLAGFAKTNILQPGSTEEITIEVDPYDFASYDCYDRNNNGFKGYELEHGAYTLSLRSSAHSVKNVTFASKEVAGDFSFNVTQDIKIANDPVTGKPVKNLFTGEDAVDMTPIDSQEKDGSYDPGIKWLTRKDFTSLEDLKTSYVARRNVTPSAKGQADSVDRIKAWNEATGVDVFGEEIPTEKPTWGASNGLKVADNGIINEFGEKLGKDYNDPDWERLLDQLSIEEVVNMIGGYYGSKALPSIGKPALADVDGPSQIKSFVNAPRGTGYPTMTTIAATWNKKLLYEFGKSFGDDMKGLGIMGDWGFAMDCHRTSFFGRNHESPSEDMMLAGTLMAEAVRGLGTRGRYNMMKHFALYGYGGEQIWMTEQGLRENFLKSFRKVVLDGGCLGVMTTYQGVGAEHSETTQALLRGVLRGEWDFKGAITTDYIGHNPYIDTLLRCGGDFGMGVKLGTIDGVKYDSSSSARVQHALRDVAHHVTYMWLRADYYEKQYKANPTDDNEAFISSVSINSWCWWKPLILTINVTAGTLLTMWGAMVLVSFLIKDEKKEKKLDAKEGK